METEKISIIIPVYNMERYLDKCVESVLRQTYANIEVLLVDDGSTDSSGTLCEHWAEKDPRIRVFHKENGGLSDARNAGIDNASGEYISFVDSDDYITPDMLEKLYRALTANAADLSLCNALFVDEDGCALETKNETAPVKDAVLTGAEAIEKTFGEKGWLFHIACCKLYKKKLFSEIRFPYGKYAEDAFVAHRIFGLCGKVACISDPCYYYLQRASSSTHKKSAKSYLHDVESFLDRACYCHDLGLLSSAGKAYWKAAMFLPRVTPISKLPPELRAEYRDAFSVFRQNYRLSSTCSTKEKLQIVFVWISPFLYNILFRNTAWQQIKKQLKAKG